MYFSCVDVNHFEDGMDERDSEDGDEASTDNEHLMTNCNLAIKILCKKKHACKTLQIQHHTIKYDLENSAQGLPTSPQSYSRRHI